MELKTFFAKSLKGPVIPNPAVYLYQVGTTTLVGGLQDANGAALTNPFTGGPTGQIQFAAPDGTYDMRVFGDGRDTTQRVRFIDIQDDEVAQVVAASATAVASAASATASQAITQIAKDAAEAAKSAAEAARDAAAVNASVYASTAAGLAATTVDQQFQVLSGDATMLIRYRHDAGPVAHEVARFATSAEWQRVTDAVLTSSDGNVWDVQDGLGKAAIAVNAAGEVLMTTVIADDVTVDSVDASSTTADVVNVRDTAEISAVTDTAFAIVDGIGRVALRVAEDGTISVHDLIVEKINGEKPVFGSTTPAPTPEFPSTPATTTWHAEINHLIGYGQSLSVGQTGGAVISTSPVYDALRFNGGVRAHDGGNNFATTRASLVPLIETVSTITPGLGETPSAGSAASIVERIQAENGLSPAQHSYQMLLSCPGEGGKTVAALSKGGLYYPRLLADIQYGYSLAQAAGKFYAVNAMTWTQGEADIAQATDPGIYRASVTQLRDDVTADAKAITGQSHNVKLITYQVGSHLKYAADGAEDAALGRIALAQLKLHEDGVSVLACPMYQFDYLGATNVHLTAESSKWLGAYYGIAYKRAVIDGAAFSPLRPLSSLRQGKIAQVTMHVPVRPLVFDTTWVAANDNMGFQLFDPLGAAITILNVSISNNTVKIVAASDIPAGSTLKYALSAGTAGGQLGRLVGPRGNLRDSQGSAIVFDPSGINKPMHNWCVMFAITL